MKKIIALLTIICILTACVPVFAQTENDAGFYKTAGILPDAVLQRGGDTAINRGEAAYIFANIFGSGKRAQCNTIFPDVMEDNIYSGYIQYVIPFDVLPIQGDGFFNPDLNVSVETFASAMLDVLGYSEIIKMEKSTDHKFALKLGLLDNVQASFNSDMTISDFVTMFNNAMDIPVMTISSIDTQGNVTYRDTDGAYLPSILGMSAYEGVILEAMDEAWNVRVRIDDNISKDNYKPAKRGEELNFSALGNIDINKYKDVPCTIWVNSDDEIFCMMPQNNVEVRYAVIDSVNGDTVSGNRYSSKYIKKLTFMDDKKNYKTDDLTVVYNLEETTKPVRLIGNYAKIVLRNNKVIFIESWELQEGGVITEITNDTITYTNGIQNTAKIRNTPDYDKKIVIIDGESVGFDRLQKDSAISYYINGRTLVLAVSEKTIDERFNGVSDNEIIIGDIGYMTADTVYYAPEGENYETDVLPAEMLGKEVHAYIDVFGKCVYVSLAKFEESDVFWAYVTGYESNTLKPDRIALMRLEPIGEKKEYTISQSVKINDDITVDELKASACDINGSGLFVFTCNKRGEINTISRPTPYWGFEDKAYGIGSQFGYDSVNAFVTVQSKNLYLHDAKIIGLYYKNGEFSVKEAKWTSLYNGRCTDVKMRVYGKEESSDIMYAVLCGATENISGSGLNHGVIYRKAEALDDFGNKICKIYVAGRNGGEYNMTFEDGKELKANQYITFNRYRLFHDSDINVRTTSELSGGIEDMQLAGNENFQYGIIKKIDSKRMYLDDGTILFLEPAVSIVQYDAQSTQKYVQSSVAAIDPGAKVAYRTDYSGVLFILFEN